jgi:prolipoprotein diacylglyceryltransferase
MILALAGGAMVVGVLVATGVFELRNLPTQFRVVMGVVVFLYGLYRLVVEYVRKPRT